MEIASQVHEMVNRNASVKLSKEVLQSWTGPVVYKSSDYTKCTFHIYSSEVSVEQQPEVQRSEFE